MQWLIVLTHYNLTTHRASTAKVARSIFAPLTVSRKTFSTPAAQNCFTWASTL
jgi:hypothetical protein